jgi:hypothetical protein
MLRLIQSDCTEKGADMARTAAPPIFTVESGQPERAFAAGHPVEVTRVSGHTGRRALAQKESPV